MVGQQQYGTDYGSTNTANVGLDLESRYYKARPQRKFN